MSIHVRPLGPAQLDAARALLVANDLPVDDLTNPAISLVGAFDEHELLGVIGLESCERFGLLRSLAVAPARRGRGVARQLCDRIFVLAGERGIRTLFLLTTTAADYFAKLGFVLVDRDATPPAIRSTAQFASLCPSSARVMQRAIASE